MREITSIHIDIARFIWEVHKNKGHLEEWAQKLTECLACRNPDLHEFGGLLLKEAESYLEQKAKAGIYSGIARRNKSLPQPEAQPKKARRGSTQEPPFEIPQNLLAINGFTEAWEKWLQHRKQIRKPLTEEAGKAQLEELVKYHDPVEGLRRATSGGWMGLNLDKYPPQVPGQPPTNGRQAGYKNQFDHVSELGDAVRRGQTRPTAQPPVRIEAQEA